MTALEMRHLRGNLGLDEVIMVGPHNGISAAVGRDTRELVLSFPIHMRTQQEVDCLQVRKRIFTRTGHADTLISDFQFPEFL